MPVNFLLLGLWVLLNNALNSVEIRTMQKATSKFLHVEVMTTRLIQPPGQYYEETSLENAP